MHFFPCYGLAEATLFVTGGPRRQGATVRSVDAAALEQGRAEPGAKPLVGCGKIWPGQDVRIVDPEAHTARPAGNVGEIWVAGPSVAAGYWGRPDETERT